MERKVRRYDAARRKHEAERRAAWRRVDEVWAERNAARDARWQAEDRERAIRRERDLLLAKHAALLAALGIALGPLGHGPLEIVVTQHALALIRLDWRTVVRSELRHRFEGEMRTIFEGAVVPLVAQAASVAELDRLLGDQGRINVALGASIVRAGELERGH